MQHNQTGFLAQYGNSDEFATQIIKLIDDKRLRADMAKKAAWWATKFDLKKTSEIFLTLISRGLITSDKNVNLSYA